MLPLVLAIAQMAQKKAQNEQNEINQLNANRVQYGANNQQQMQTINTLPQQSNGIGNAFSTISSVYGGLFGGK